MAPSSIRGAAPHICSTRRSPGSKRRISVCSSAPTRAGEAPLVNARLRKHYVQGGFRVAAIGPALDLTFPVEMLGDGGAVLNALAAGATPLGRRAARCQKPDDCSGAGGARPPRRRPAFLGAAGVSPKIAGWFATIGTGSMSCTRAAARVGKASISALCQGAGGRDVSGIIAGCQIRRHRNSYTFSAPRDRYERSRISLVIYQGHHGERGALRADVVLPGAAYTEKDGTYVNTEGRVRLRATRCSRPERRARTGRSCAPFPAPSAARCCPSIALRDLRPPDVGRSIRYWPNRMW